MYDHIGLKVKDLDASVRFYSAALAPLGHELCSHDGTGASFGPAKAPALSKQEQLLTEIRDALKAERKSM